MALVSCRKLDSKGAALTQTAFQVQAAVHLFQESFAEQQAQAGTLLICGAPRTILGLAERITI